MGKWQNSCVEICFSNFIVSIGGHSTLKQHISFSSSKLSSLFGMASSAGSNESLTYTAPKQPKAKGLYRSY